MTARFRWRFLTLASLSLLACKADRQSTTLPATTVLVRIAAPSDVQAVVRQLRVQVSVQADNAEKWLERPAVTLDMSKDRVGASARWPVDVPVVPQDAEKLPKLFEVVAEGIAENGEVLVQQRAITRFVKRTELMIELVLARCGTQEVGSLCEADAACHGLGCRSCSAGACDSTPVTEASELRPPELMPAREPTEPMEPTEPAPDAGVAADGGNTGGAGGSVATGEPEVRPPGLPPLQWNAPVELETHAPAALLVGAARNRKGDAAIAWWQNAPDGYLWVRRNLHGDWDKEPLRISGSSNPAPYTPSVGVGVENDGTVQVIWPGNTSCRWIRWNGEVPASTDGTDMAAPAQSQCEPMGFVVDEFGTASALWAHIGEETATEKKLYKNSFRVSTGWGTPSVHGSLVFDAGRRPYGAGIASSNGTGWFAMMQLFPGVADSSQLGQSQIKKSQVYIGKFDAITESTLMFPDFVQYVTYGIDNDGDVSAFIATGTEPARSTAYAYRFAQRSGTWEVAHQLSSGHVEGLGGTLFPDSSPLAVWFERPDGQSKGPGKVMASLHDASGWSPVPLSTGIEILPQSYLAGDANVAGKALIVWSQKTTLADGSPGSAIYHAQYIRERGWSQAGLVTESPNNLLVGWVVLRENGTGTVVIMSAAPGSSEQDLLSVTSK